jgi:hypothetical protein
MKIFKVNENIQIICDRKTAKNGFKHIAKLMVNKKEKTRTSISYMNRTWESYEYESVLNSLVGKVKKIDSETLMILKDYLKNYDPRKDSLDDFSSVANIAKLGGFFTDNQKESNEWKKKMLLAGFGNQGLFFPDDWDDLDEDVKETRLDEVIKTMEKKYVNS